MKKSFVALCFFVCFCLLKSSTSFAQYYYYNDRYYGSDLVFELGGGVGIMNSLTDLGGKKGIGKGFVKDLNLNISKPSFSLYFMGTYKDALGIRLQGTFGRVEGYDTILKKVATSTFGRYERNLSFRSKISDFQLAAEIHPLFFRYYDEGEAPFWSPYLVAGIGFFSFNPEAKLNGSWHALQPLHTEGQGFREYPDREEYSLTQINIPLGFGIKYELGTFLNVRFEIIHRILFTDYLDDVSTTYIDPALFGNYLTGSQATIAQKLYSRVGELTPGSFSAPGAQRGDPKDNDSFFTIQLKIGYVIRAGRR